MRSCRPSEAWIGTEDLRPRRVRLVLKADGLTGLPVSSLDLDLTADLSGFGYFQRQAGR